MVNPVPWKCLQVHLTDALRKTKFNTFGTRNFRDYNHTSRRKITDIGNDYQKHTHTSEIIE